MTTPETPEATMPKTGLLVPLCLLPLAALPKESGGGAGGPAATTLRFEATVARGLAGAPRDGRLLVVLGRKTGPEPRATIGETGLKAPPLLGRDVDGFGPGMTAAVDQTAAIFPIGHLSRLPRGEYAVQAVFHANRDLNVADAPGNLYSDSVLVTLDPAKGGTVRLELRHTTPPDEPPPDTAEVKYVKLRSDLLSRFHGRPMYLRAGVLLPRGYDKDRDRRYPLFVRVGGYGTRYTAAGRLLASPGFRRAWEADDAPRFLLLHLDGAGPYGDPYQVNSANNGPHGDAVTRELIPYVERTFRGVGTPQSRVVEGHSTGGWVSLALQVFYPDFFNGCWSHAPDPVDFRAYELINIYGDANAYVNPQGFERPAARELNGDVRYTVRHECQLEVVLGRGDRWWLSGKDWCAWNAVFGPRGADGLPRPLWDGRTGALDAGVLEHWKQYDLRRVLEGNWATLGPKLRGKIHVWVGEADDFFLNNAVHLLDASLARARPPFVGRITYGPGQGHGWRGLSDRQLLAEMGEAVGAGR
jgi:S-formylglutathione hydrolase FrmB